MCGLIFGLTKDRKDRVTDGSMRLSELLVRNMCFANCVDKFIIIFLFQSFEMFSLLLMTFMANPLFLLL